MRHWENRRSDLARYPVLEVLDMLRHLVVLWVVVLILQNQLDSLSDLRPVISHSLLLLQPHSALLQDQLHLQHILEKVVDLRVLLEIFQGGLRHLVQVQQFLTFRLLGHSRLSLLRPAFLEALQCRRNVEVFRELRRNHLVSYKVFLRADGLLVHQLPDRGTQLPQVELDGAGEAGGLRVARG